MHRGKRLWQLRAPNLQYEGCCSNTMTIDEIKKNCKKIVNNNYDKDTVPL